MASSWPLPLQRTAQHPYRDATFAEREASAHSRFPGSRSEERRSQPGARTQASTPARPAFSPQGDSGGQRTQHALLPSVDSWLFGCGGDVCTDGTCDGERFGAPRHDAVPPVQAARQRAAGIGAVLTISASGEVVFHSAVPDSAAWDAMRWVVARERYRERARAIARERARESARGRARERARENARGRARERATGSERELPLVLSDAPDCAPPCVLVAHPPDRGT